MNREWIRQQLVGQGSFVIRTSDGKGFQVSHPEFVLVGRGLVHWRCPPALLDR